MNCALVHNDHSYWVVELKLIMSSPNQFLALEIDTQNQIYLGAAQVQTLELQDNNDASDKVHLYSMEISGIQPVLLSTLNKANNGAYNDGESVVLLQLEFKKKVHAMTQILTIKTLPDKTVSVSTWAKIYQGKKASH